MSWTPATVIGHWPQQHIPTSLNFLIEAFGLLRYALAGFEPRQQEIKEGVQRDGLTFRIPPPAVFQAA